MLEKRWQNEYRSTMICVDRCDFGILEGRLYNPYIRGGEQFRSLMELILRMEELLDQMRFPESYTEHRSFRRERGVTDTKISQLEASEGRCGTFILKVLFRQNASWQGTLTWLDGHQEESFRSVLELIHLLSSALREAPDAEQLKQEKSKEDSE